MSKAIKIEQHSGLGLLWFIGWLFTVGFLKAGFWKGVLALLVWPYFLGGHFADQPSHEIGSQAQVEEQH